MTGDKRMGYAVWCTRDTLALLGGGVVEIPKRAYGDQEKGKTPYASPQEGIAWLVAAVSRHCETPLARLARLQVGGRKSGAG